MIDYTDSMETNKLKRPADNSTTTLEGPVFNNVKRKRQPKKQWPPLVDAGSKRKQSKRLKNKSTVSIRVIVKRTHICVYIYFLNDIDAFYIHLKLFQKIKTDTLKKTCMRKTEIHTSDSDSDHEATPNKERKKVCCKDEINN